MAAEEKKSTTKIEAKGDAFIITAGIKYDDIQNLIKYGKGNALTLINKETKETIFVVDIKSKGDVSKYGISFTSKNAQGFAEVTLNFKKLNMSKDEKTEYLKDNFAYVISYVDEIQKQVEEAVKVLNKLMQNATSAINVD